jgi:hypothetical protein
MAFFSLLNCWSVLSKVREIPLCLVFPSLLIHRKLLALNVRRDSEDRVM